MSQRIASKLPPYGAPEGESFRQRSQQLGSVGHAHDIVEILRSQGGSTPVTPSSDGGRIHGRRDADDPRHNVSSSIPQRLLDVAEAQGLIERQDEGYRLVEEHPAARITPTPQQIDAAEAVLRDALGAECALKPQRLRYLASSTLNRAMYVAWLLLSRSLPIPERRRATRPRRTLTSWRSRVGVVTASPICTTTT